MKRGDIVTFADGSQDYGNKPRVAVVVQSALYNDTHASITVAPITSTLRNDATQFRITVEPSPANGLRLVSQVMVDRLLTPRRERVRKVVGHLDDVTITRVTRAIALWLGIA